MKKKLLEIVKKKKKKRAKKSKKTIGLFYKISFSILLLATLTLSYSIILVSKPRSISYVTDKIETRLKDNFGPRSKFNSVKVNFTYYGSLKLSINKVQINYSDLEDKSRQQVFLIPKIEAEISIFDILLMDFHLKRVKFFNPTIVIDDFVDIGAGGEILKKEPSDHISLISSMLSKIQNEQNFIEDIEVENANLLLRNNNSDLMILLKKSHITSKRKDGNIYLTARNVVNFLDGSEDIILNSNCEFLNMDSFKCKLILDDFVVSSISKIDPSLNILSNIDATIRLDSSFAIMDQRISDFSFEVEAKDGSFKLTDLFKDKVSFKKFRAAGKYDSESGEVNFPFIDVDFKSGFKGVFNDPKFSMSLLISDFLNKGSRKFKFLIKLDNLLGAETNKYWPVFLQKNKVYPWVRDHISGGKIKKSYAKFSLAQEGEKMVLSDIDSGIKFSRFDLTYNKNFPDIDNLSGFAYFNKKGMKISLRNGDVLGSKLYGGLVKIDDFKENKLLISGKVRGSSRDVFEHISYKSKFAREISSYFSGNANSSFNISLPVISDVKLRDFYINVSSLIAKVDSGYARGELSLNSVKDLGSNEFINNVDFTKAKLNFRHYDIYKKNHDESVLSFRIDVKNNKILDFKDVKIQKPLSKKGALAKITGDFKLRTDPFEILSANISNRYFGNNDYKISYNTNLKDSEENLRIEGKKMNLKPFMGSKGSLGINKKVYSSRDYEIDLDKIYLLNKKSVTDFSLFWKCGDGFCHNFGLSCNYKDGKLIDIERTKIKSRKKLAKFEGDISDIGYIAESLGISKLVMGGKAEIEAENKMVDGKQLLKGELEIDDEFTVFENETFKKLGKNDLFSQVKDKIFSSGKTTFNSSDLVFNFSGNILNIESFVANNYKIGITATGFVDLSSRTYKIKGMIVPGFLINNLFGIGKIPILGNIISGVLTGGEEGGGVFGLKYKYEKSDPQQEAIFETNKVTSFVPSTIQNLFD